MARILTVSSGKGGVGKTNISVNMALYLASQGYRTCVFDADLGLANINILLNISPEYDLEDVITGTKHIEDIIIRDVRGIDIIPGSSGVPKLADLDSQSLTELLDSLSRLDAYDFVIFDTSAGISKNVISFCLAASELILVVTPEPTSLVDAYALLKVLSLNGYDLPVMVTVNQGKNLKVADKVFNKLKATVEKYLPLKLKPLGTVLQDSSVARAVAEQRPFICAYPNTTASKCIKNITRHLLRKKSDKAAEDSLGMFWSRFLSVLKSPVLVSSSSPGSSGAKSLPVKTPAAQPDLAERTSSDNGTGATRPSDRGAVDIPLEADSAQPIQVLLQKLVENTTLISKELVEIKGMLAKDTYPQYPN